MDCLFCNIDNSSNTKKIFDDENFFVIKDISPAAEVHLLAIPHRHFALLEDMNDGDIATFGKIVAVIAENSKFWGIASGYRLIINQGADAHQSVQHLHIHIVGGQDLGAKIL